MVSLQESILQSRQEISKAKTEAEKKAKEIRLPRRTLEYQQKYIKTGMIPMGRVEAIAKERKALGKKMISEAAGEEARFEQEVAIAAPEEAKPQYIESAYEQAKQQVQTQMAPVQREYESIEAMYGTTPSYDTARREYLQDRMFELKQKINAYKSELAKSKTELIKSVYSGEYQARAEAISEAAQAQVARGEAQRGAAKLSSTEIIKQISKQYPELKAGEIADIARKQYPEKFPTPVGAKPQLEFKEVPGGFEFRRKETPVVSEEKLLKPFGEVRPLTKEEQFFYNIEKSKGYQLFEKAWEPFGLVATGAGAFVSTIPGYAIEPFLKLGRKEEETSLQAKAWRGGLMFGKTTLLFSNPYTGVPSALYFGGKTIENIGKSPLGFAQQTYKYVKEEPFEFAGGLAGMEAGTKIWDISKTALKTRIPEEQLIPLEVLTGKKTFPEAARNPEVQLKLFLKESQRLPKETEPTGFHAAPSPLSEFIVKKSESEFPGLYVSYGVSPHFLKLSKQSLSGLKLNPSQFMSNLIEGTFSRWGKPSVAAIKGQEFIIGKSGEPGQAFIPGIKTEVEAVIVPGTRLIPKGSRYFFKYKGRRIPIFEFEAVKGKAIKGIGTENILGSYYLPSESSRISLDIFGISQAVSSYKVSKKIISSASILKPSTSSKVIMSKIGISPAKDILKISSYTSPQKAISKTSPKISPLKIPPSNVKSLYPALKTSPTFAQIKKPTIQVKGKYKKKEKKIKKRFGITKYIPSFAASILKITASKKPKKILGGYSFGFRPLVFKKTFNKRKQRFK